MSANPILSIDEEHELRIAAEYEKMNAAYTRKDHVAAEYHCREAAVAAAD